LAVIFLDFTPSAHSTNDDQLHYTGYTRNAIKLVKEGMEIKEEGGDGERGPRATSENVAQGNK